MKSTGVPILVFGVAMTIAVGCSRPTEEQPAAVASEGSPEPQSRVRHGTNGEVVVALEPLTQKVMGLQTAVLEAAQFTPQIKAYGRVMDVLPLISLVADLTAARATGEASQAELKRLRTLVSQNNASERALEAAAAAAARDSASVESVRLKLLAGWGAAVSERKDLPELVRALSSLSACLVKVDVPAGESLHATPTAARLYTLADGDKPIEAQLLGPAPTADPQTQGQGFLLLVNPNASRLAPGAAVTARLTLPGASEAGVIVPHGAVIRLNGVAWVYLQADPGTFQRVEVTLESPLEKGWFVRRHLKPGDRVVSVGAQQLLSEELKGAGGEE